jgi:hypothetical protein
MGYARPVLLTADGAWEAVLENAYDIIVISEVNGEDTLHFKLPFRDQKRSYLENEKKIQIVDDIYKIRTINDIKDSTGIPIRSKSTITVCWRILPRHRISLKTL